MFKCEGVFISAEQARQFTDKVGQYILLNNRGDLLLFNYSGKTPQEMLVVSEISPCPTTFSSTVSVLHYKSNNDGEKKSPSLAHRRGEPELTTSTYASSVSLEIDPALLFTGFEHVFWYLDKKKRIHALVHST